MRKAYCHSLPLCAAIFFGLASVPVQAQITPDATLPNNSIVLPNGNVFTIEGGTEAQSNLFHSFEEFSIPTGSEAFFNNAVSIDNIITRITGGNISDIDGLIRANSTANLFLINPNGIQFGPNASLDIGGSFLGSTANSLLFEDGSFFSATQPNASPLLTVSVPVGLQMGSNSGSITVQNEGHALTGGFFIPFNFNDTATGLQVSPGETLGLISREIHLPGGILRVPGGNIHLSGIEEGIVQFDLRSPTWQFETLEVESFGDLHLSDQALIDTSGVLTGNIQLQGRNINLDEGSTVLIQNSGTQASGNVTVNATNSVRVSGAVRNAPDLITPSGTIPGVIPSQIFTQTLGTGQAGEIMIQSEYLSLIDSARVISLSFSDGNTGDIAIHVGELMEVKGSSPLTNGVPAGLASSINIRSVSSGNLGEINVFAGNLEIFQGNITSINSGSGQGSNININIRENLQLSGVTLETASPAAIGATTFGEGDSGNLTINTASLFISDGANIGTSSVAQGNAGEVIVNASESIEIRGEVPEIDSVSGLLAGVPIFDPILRQILGLPDLPSGNAGSVTVNTPNLTIAEGGEVSVSNKGSGNSGDLEIHAERIFLDTGGSITAFSASGQGGNIELNVRDDLLLRDRSAITAEATGTLASNPSVDGGNITLDADLATLLENSRINANAFAGSGGNIQITTQSLLVSPDSAITASSQFGIDGTVSVNNPIVDPASGLVALDTNPLNPNTQIQDSCDIATKSRFTIIGSGGLPEDPTQPLPGRTVWRDTRLGEIPTHLTPNSPETEPGEASVPPIPLVEATGWIQNDRGDIELVAQGGNLSHSSWQPHPDCKSLPESDRSDLL